MKCPRCSYDPDAKVTASWTFTIERAVVSLNERGTNRGAWKTRKAYKADRDAWGWLIRAKRLEFRIPKAKGKRRLTLTRLYSGRQREFDKDNMAGLKLVVDAFVLDGLLLDDTSALAEVHFQQERAIQFGLVVVIEDLA